MTMSDYQDEVERNGFAIVPDVLLTETVDGLCKQLDEVDTETASSRAGRAFGLRNLLNVVPVMRELGGGPLLRSLVEPVLGHKAKVVRGVFLDKHKDANWKVAWHQDLTIAVKQRIEVEGYGPWSLKAGIQHVQPPVKVLEKMLAIRVHLDDTDDSNGGLRVLPGSHLMGRLRQDEIQRVKNQIAPVSCQVKRGDVMLMRPLLLHTSSVAIAPRHRRVLHFEYAVGELQGGLEWYEASEGQ